MWGGECLAGYWAADDIEPAPCCPVCGESGASPLYSGLVDVEEGVPGQWSMSRCRACNSLFLDPRPTLAALRKAYRSYYTHKPPGSENAILSAKGWLPFFLRVYLRQRFGWNGKPRRGLVKAAVAFCPPLAHQLAYYMRHLPAISGRLLDVGCGNGAFMVRAMQAGWEVEGTETDEVAARVARDSTCAQVHQGLDCVQPLTFDEVTLCHVIEHLHSPSELLRDCFRVLKPGGRIWVATPNIAGIGHRCFRSDWQPLEAPRHLAIPSMRGLELLLRAAGFVNVRFHRRGRGSKNRIDASARRSPSSYRSWATRFVLSQWIDLSASFSSRAAEELVVTAEVPLS